MNNVGAKSFAVLNENGLIVEMIEKSLASNFVNVGLYGFDDADEYLKAFDTIAAEGGDSEIFVSHVMNHAIARGMVVEQHHPRYGTLRLPNLPFRFSDCDTTIREVAPDLGQHNAEVAQSLGFDPAEIDAMQTDGVLFSK